MPKSLDDLVRENVPDGTSMTDLRQFVGYEGTSDEPDRRYRLYLSLSRQEYIEVPQDKVTVIPLGGDSSPFVLVQVDKDVTVDHVSIMSPQEASGFLGGTLVAHYLAGASMTRFPLGTGLLATHISWVCNSIGWCSPIVLTLGCPPPHGPREVMAEAPE